MTQKSGKANLWILPGLILIGLVGLGLVAKAVTPGLFGFLPGFGGGESIPSRFLTTKAAEAPFLVSLNVLGSLDSQSNLTLSSKVEGQTTIIKIIDEGTMVKEGDVLVELDSAPLEDQVKTQEITVTQAKAAWEQAIENLKIQDKQNDSDIAAAELKLELAKLDLESYVEGEFPQLEKQLSGNILLAEEELLRNEKTYEFTLEQVKKGYRTQDELEAAQLAVKQSRLKLDGAKEEYKVLTQFTQKRKVAELQANAKEFANELERVKIKAKAALTQFEAEVRAAELTYNVEKEKFDKTKVQIEACTIKAPSAGEVVYANMSSSSRRSSEPVNIEEGASVRENQALINLPDVTKMKVDARIHESLIGSIRKDLPARIRISSYPDEVFNGIVANVSSVPMAGQWPNTDLREYATEIRLTDSVEKISKLRPGLTAQIEILVDNRQKVLQVPIQCIVSVTSEQIAYIIKNSVPERRTVKTGLATQSHVEIIDGLEPGDDVVMNPRSQFIDEISELEAVLSKEKEEKDASMEIPEGTAPVVPGPGGFGPAAGGPGGSGAAGGGPGAGGPSGPGGGGPGAGGGGPRDPAAFFDSRDTDKDGKLSKDEVPEPMQARFDTMDTDKDGKISKEEFAAGRRPPGQ